MMRMAVLGLAMLVQMGGLGDAPAKPKQYVTYTAEETTVAAGKKSMVEMHFKVTDGYHVNSHTPKSELLIPTNLKLEPANGVKMGVAEYSKGTEYSFSFEPGEKLDVYTGAFTVKMPVEVASGQHTMGGVLRYQACDHAACYPPKSLAVSVALVAK